MTDETNACRLRTCRSWMVKRASIIPPWISLLWSNCLADEMAARSRFLSGNRFMTCERLAGPTQES